MQPTEIVAALLTATVGKSEGIPGSGILLRGVVSLLSGRGCHRRRKASEGVVEGLQAGRAAPEGCRAYPVGHGGLPAALDAAEHDPGGGELGHGVFFFRGRGPS